MRNLLNSSSYPSTVRDAHGLADLLKRVRPDVRQQAEELQAIVTRAHTQLDELNQRGNADSTGTHQTEEHGSWPNSARDGEAASVLTNLEAAYQALRDLKHPVKSVPAEAEKTQF